MRILIILSLCTLFISITYSEKLTQEQTNAKLAKYLEDMYKEYFSSSLLYQCLAHYFNRSTLALPGVGGVFRQFSVVDEQHAKRILELTAMRGFYFSSHHIDTHSIIKKAFTKYREITKRSKGIMKKLKALKEQRQRLEPETEISKRVKELKTEQKKLKEEQHFCLKIKLDDQELDALNDFLTDKFDQTHLPRSHSVLKLAQVIENCSMAINIKRWKIDPHLNYIILREFLSEQVTRRKYIADVLQKLRDDDRLTEFFVDKALRSTALKY